MPLARCGDHRFSPGSLHVEPGAIWCGRGAAALGFAVHSFI
jgi:hypothetical protein